MKLFPNEQIILITPLSQDSVLEKINNNISTEKHFSALKSVKGEKPFQGMVFSDNFRIKRNLVYRNSFLPTTYGQVNSTSGGSEIFLTIKMGKFQFIFFVTWTILIAILTLISLFVLIAELLYSGQLTLWALICPAMFLVGYLYIKYNFKKEMIATKRFLMTLVEAREI